MKWIFYGLNDSILIQALLLFWSLYGIYVAIMKNNNLDKKINYRIFPKNKHKKVLFWYIGNRCSYFSNYLNYIVKIDNTIEKIKIRSNCKIDKFKFRNNKIIISRNELIKNDMIEIDLYSHKKTANVTIESDDINSFKFVECKKKPFFIIIVSIYFTLSLLFGSLSLLISSFIDIKWNYYYLLKDEVKQYGVNFDYSFEEEYSSIYEAYYDNDIRNFEISVAILNRYEKKIPLYIFVKLDEEILITRVKYTLECIALIIILLFWSIKYFYTLPPKKSKRLKYTYNIIL